MKKETSVLVATTVVLLLAMGSSAAAGDDRVKVVALTESLCPNCIDFVQTDLEELARATDVLARVHLRLLAWGNAYTETTSAALCPSATPGRYDVAVRRCWNARCVRTAAPALFAECFNTSFAARVTCQHGAEECLGNRIETCAVALTRNATDGGASRAGVDFVRCFVGTHRGDPAALTPCAAAAHIDRAALVACVNGADGVAFLREAAIATNDQGPHPGVPYVLVNGTPLPDGQTLLAAVCAQLPAPKPAGCASVRARTAPAAPVSRC